MKLFRSLLLSTIALACAQACLATPAFHAGDVLILTRDGKLALFHPENGTWENFASLGSYHNTTAMVRETSGNFVISDQYAGAVLRLNPSDGSSSVLSQGNLIGAPSALALGKDGSVYEVDPGLTRIVRIDPVTGDQSTVAEYHFLMMDPISMRLGPDGNLYVVNLPLGADLYRVNVTTGDQTLVSEYGLFFNPYQMEFMLDGSILVSDWGPTDTQLIRVDPTTGAQTILVSGLPRPVQAVSPDGSGGFYLGEGDNIPANSPGTLLRFDGSASVVTVAQFPFAIQALYVFPGNGPVRTKGVTWGSVKGLYR